MFKQLTNVRKEKNESAELTTTPTAGTCKINSAGLGKIKCGLGDYVTVIEDVDDNTGEVKGIYLGKGSAPSDGKNAIGSKLSSSANKNAGSMDFSSGNAWSKLGGNENNKQVYSIGDEMESPLEGISSLYLLTPVRTEEKAVRTKKAQA